MFGPDKALSNAGAYGVEDLNVVRYTFSGRRSRIPAALEGDGDRLIAMAEETVSAHANVTGNPRRELLARKFTPGLCGYHPDQADFLTRLASAVDQLEGLVLTGDYLRGCSIEACFASAEQAIAGARAPNAHRPRERVG